MSLRVVPRASNMIHLELTDYNGNVLSTYEIHNDGKRLIIHSKTAFKVLGQTLEPLGEKLLSEETTITLEKKVQK